MNEQLIVKNFGPIKDATVDFKRVTVFIGPTGGGKSTLAKLISICKDSYTSDGEPSLDIFKTYTIENYLNNISYFSWISDDDKLIFDKQFKLSAGERRNNAASRFVSSLTTNSLPPDFYIKLREYAELRKSKDAKNQKTIESLAQEFMNVLLTRISAVKSQYIPSDRGFITSISSSFAGLMRDDIGISKPLLNFANAFFQARDEIHSLEIEFLDTEYFRHDNKDYISFSVDNKLLSLQLNETASGIQSVTPMLVLLEHLSQNTEQAQSFIIEEPELNLYPTAQQGLLNWLVEKCTKGENDLTITTHSPYVLSHLNLLLYAYQVAEQHPERADEVAELVPRESWINPKEFACYQVENGGVTSLVNEDLGLIDDNGLDGLSGDAADAFDNLIRLSKGVALK